MRLVGRTVTLSALGLTLVGALVVGAGTAAASTATTVVADNPRTGTFVAGSPGETMKLVFPTCTDCAYEWTVARAPRSTVMRLASVRVVPLTHPDPSKPPIAGAPSLTTFTYVVTGLGQTSVRLRYAQSFNVRASARYLSIRLVGVRQARTSAGFLYSVRSGDTLYRIARRTLGHGSPLQVARLANRLYADNRAVIGANGNFLLPREVLLVDPSGA
jgi:hypothetical protein